MHFFNVVKNKYFVENGKYKVPIEEIIPADEDVLPVLDCVILVAIPATNPVPLPVGGDITTSSAQPEAMYAEIRSI